MARASSSARPPPPSRRVGNLERRRRRRRRALQSTLGVGDAFHQSAEARSRQRARTLRVATRSVKNLWAGTTGRGGGGRRMPIAFRASRSPLRRLGVQAQRLEVRGAIRRRAVAHASTSSIAVQRRDHPRAVRRRAPPSSARRRSASRSAASAVRFAALAPRRPPPSRVASISRRVPPPWRARATRACRRPSRISSAAPTPIARARTRREEVVASPRTPRGAPMVAARREALRTAISRCAILNRRRRPLARARTPTRRRSRPGQPRSRTATTPSKPDAPSPSPWQRRGSASPSRGSRIEAPGADDDRVPTPTATSRRRSPTIRGRSRTRGPRRWSSSAPRPGATSNGGHHRRGVRSSFEHIMIGRATTSRDGGRGRRRRHRRVERLRARPSAAR